MEQAGGALIRLTLPWPHKDLSPNARVHWAAKARLTKAARLEAFYVTRGAMVGKPKPEGDRIEVMLDFFPPDRRRRDDANCMAAMKSAIDGVADGLGIDDHKFMTSYWLRSEVVKGGEVRVTVEAV